MTHPLPSQDRLKELFDYAKDSGALVWRPRDGEPRKVGAHNARFAGRVAGNVARRGARAYIVIEVDGSPRYAHRIIYKMMTGHEPDMIDHINGDGLDNRWVNLRAASNHDNQGNRRVRSDARSGIKCVRRHGDGYSAYITKQGKFFHLGTFPTAAEANEVYLAAARDYFSEFARAT